MKEKESAPGLMPVVDTYSHIVSSCLQMLNSCSAGVALYILNCLYREDFNVVMELVHLDLSQSHQHNPLSEERVGGPHSSEDLLQAVQARARSVPTQDYGHFWLELTRNWLLSCPVDRDYYRVDETGKELFCQKLRNDLLDRILNIN